MIPHTPFDEELLAFQEAVKTHEIVYYNDEIQDKLLQGLFNTLFDNLVNKIPTIILSQSVETIKQIQTLLDQYDLKKYCIDLTEPRLLSSGERLQLTKTNIQNKSLNASELETMFSFAEQENKNIENLYQKLTQNVFGSKNVKQLTEAYHKVLPLLEAEELGFEINDAYFVFNQEEFWNLRNQLNESISKYNPIFSVIEQTNPIGSNLSYAAEGNRVKSDILDQHIAQVKKVINTLNQQVEQYLTDLKMQFESQKLITINGIKELRENLLFINRNNEESKKGFLGLGAKKNIDLSPLQTKLNQLINNFETEESVKQLAPTKLHRQLNVHGLNETIKHLEGIQIGQMQSDAVLQKLTLNHLGEKINSRIRNSIEKTIQDINVSEILNQKIESGGFTFKHQLKTFNHLLLNLLNIQRLQNQFKPYINWRQHLKNQSRELKHLLEALKIHPASSWILLFEAWYIKKLISKYKPNTKALNYQFDYTSKLHQRILEEKLAFIQSHYSVQREQAKQALKKTNKALFKKLNSKKEPQISWQELVDSGEFISNFFPIIIASDIKSLKANKFAKQYILFDHSQFLESDIFLNAAAKLFIVDSKNNSSIRSYLSEKSYHQLSLDIPYQVSAHLIDYKQSNRFSTIKTLAKNIYALNPNYTYFQTKDFNIVAYCSAYKSNSLVEYFSSSGIKQLPHNDSDAGLIESMIDEGKQVIFLFEDDLLNPKKSELLFWQFHLLQCLSHLSVNCYSIKNDDYYAEGETYLSRIWHSINQSSENHKKPQEIKEHVIN